MSATSRGTRGTRGLHLNAFLQFVGHHEAAWRVGRAGPHAGWDVAHYRHLARVAERGRMDAVFFGDSPAAYGSDHSELAHRPLARLDPTVLLSDLGASTSNIGLIATASTTYTEPYELARRLASLDHVTGGRSGWNIVTTSSAHAARNFGLDGHPDHATRYERAAEFLEVALALWGSWPVDAVLADRVRGRFADADRIRAIDHVGARFRVAGPLNVPRPPQGHPVLVQAGSSADGIAFAGRYAEAVFTARLNAEGAKAFADRLRAEVAAAGRDPRGVLILPGLVPVLGGTEAEARAAKRRLDEAVVPGSILPAVSRLLGIPLTEADLDRTLLPGDLPDGAGERGSRSALVQELLGGARFTVGELVVRYAAGRAHLEVTGTPEQVADVIEDWYLRGAADGFNIMPPVFPEGLEDFVDHVIPILRRRGLFRTDYEGTTLRDHYGLPVPEPHDTRRKAPR
ncbi:LLM class flavin-dependent oxidoreductase [Actinacidiphila alni]|uniref:LLM class flavin-dependent oxidoreductase n=1 Tax=Actinacidiphila alni TaxID=380248 RepID=UPI003456BC2A